MEDGDIAGREGGRGGWREQGGPKDKGNCIGRIEPCHADVPSLNVGRGGGPGVGVPGGGGGGGGKQDEEEAEKEKDREESGRVHGL